jgi:hypothetical protein
LPGTIADVWEAEKPTLMALPPAFDGFVEHSKRVSPTCLITFERNRYSVPASFANRRVSLHVYPDRLVVVAEGQTVCTHARIIERSHHKPGKVIYDWRHYLAVIQRKPGRPAQWRAVHRDAGCLPPPAGSHAAQGRWRPGDGRYPVTGSPAHDEDAVLCAVELALEAGVPTKTHILNLLHRLIDRKPTDHPEVDPPDALALETTPRPTSIAMTA